MEQGHVARGRRKIVTLPFEAEARWKVVVELLSKPEDIKTIDDLAQVIMKIKPDLVPEIMAHFTLDGLGKVINDASLPFFDLILPHMCQLALQLPDLFPSSSSLHYLIPKAEQN